MFPWPSGGDQQRQLQWRPQIQQTPQNAQIAQASRYTQTTQAAQPCSYPQTPQPAPYNQMPQLSPAYPYQQAPRPPQAPATQVRQAAQTTPTTLTQSMPQYPEQATLAQQQQVPQLRIVPMPHARPGEAPPRLIVSDHNMQRHHVGQTTAGPIFEECKCPGYYRHDSGVLASGATSSSAPAQQQEGLQSAGPRNILVRFTDIEPSNNASSILCAGRFAGLLDSLPHNHRGNSKDRDLSRRRGMSVDSDPSSDDSSLKVSHHRRKSGSRRSSRH